jgi:hypothetical protein
MEENDHIKCFAKYQYIIWKKKFNKGVDKDA